MEGVCCECQTTHPVHPARSLREREMDLEEDDSDGEVGGYVMDIHDAWGSHCDGSGTMPQAVLKDNKI